MKVYWLVAGLGVLAAIVGAVLYTVGGRPSLGFILITGGIIVAVLGVAMRVALAYIGDRAK